MSRASWGGQANTGDLFTSLVNEDFRQIQAGINEGVNKAQAEQSANDTEMQAKWKAGKISDSDWLTYIKQRIKQTTDPQQRAQWQQILLQNQDAISDAQWETKFQQNKVTVGQLMQHYRNRMGGIAQDSPAYRDLASRFVELQQFQRSGGVHYSDQYAKGGSGGGSGGGSSGSGGGSAAGGAGTGSLSDIIKKGLAGGQTDIGYQGGEIYNTQGPDVVSVLFGSPATNSKASLGVAATAGLEGSIKQLEAFYQFLQDNPKATVYTSHGQVIPINPDTIRAADDQYLRLKQTSAAVYYARGGGYQDNGDSELADAVHFVSTTMRDHNTAAIQPVLDQFLGLAKAQIVRIGKIADPNLQQQAWKTLSKSLDDFVSRKLPQESSTGTITSGAQQGVDMQAGPQQHAVDIMQRNALENLVSPEVYDQMAMLRQLADIGTHPSQYSSQQVSDIYDNAQELGVVGEGANQIRLADLVGGSSVTGVSSSMGNNFVGVGQQRLNALGLTAAKLIEAGQLNPADAVDDLGDPIPLVTYQWDGNQIRLGPAVVQNVNGAPTVVPMDAQGTANTVAFVTDVGGIPTKVWTAVNSDTPAAGYVYRVSATGGLKVGDIVYKKGDLVPSSVLAQFGTNGLRQELQAGQIAKAAIPGTATANILGKTWYYDARTNGWSPTVPWNAVQDATDPAAFHVSDPAFVEKFDAQGNSIKEIDYSATNGDTTRIGMSLAPGLQPYAVPFSQISGSQMQAWLDNQVADGRINPADYQSMSADGLTMDPIDINTMYYDPNLDSSSLGLQGVRDMRGGMREGDQAGASTDMPDPAMAHQAQAQEVAIRQWEHQNIGAQRGFWKMQGQDVADPTQAVTDQLKQFSAALGIRTGDLSALDRALPGAAPGMQRAAFADPSNPYSNYGPGIAEFQADAFTAAASRLKQQALPKLEPLPAAPRPPVARLEGLDKPTAPVINPLQSVAADNLSSVSSSTAAVAKQRAAGKGLTQ